MAAAPGNDDALDGSSAHEAGLAFAAIDAMLQLKKSLFSVGIYVIGNGRTPERDGFFQYFPHGCVELFQL